MPRPESRRQDPRPASRRRLVPLLIAASGLAACASTHRVDPPRTEPASDVQANKLLVRRYYEEVVSTGDVERIALFVSPDYAEVYQGTRYEIGLEGAVEHVLGVRTTYPDLVLEVDRQVAEGEWVASRLRMHGTHAGAWMGIEPTGQRIDVTAVNLDRVVDGRIVEHGGAANLLEPLLRAGAIQAAPPPTLPEPEREVFQQALEWSPDGERIAFSEFSGGEFSPDKWAVHVVAVDEGATAAARLVARGATFCSWSPEGERLVYEATRDGNRDLFVRSVDGGEELRLTHDEARDVHPAWSPGGERIVFSSDRAGSSDLYVLELEGGVVTRLTTGEAKDLNPSWSVDGEGIVFFREKGDGKDQVWIVGRESGDERRVTSGAHHNVFPSFLPDGRVGYTRVREDGSKELVCSRADGSALQRVGRVPVSFARWSPDGRRVAFVAGRWPRSAIYLMNADGTGLRKLVN